MKANTEPLLPETFYHIYNRGINKEDLFKEERNYSFFLEKYNKLISPIANLFLVFDEKPFSSANPYPFRKKN